MKLILQNLIIFTLFLIQTTLSVHDIYSLENVGLKQILDNSGCMCGIERVSSRIINGIEIKRGRYPWFAQLPICGGFLISNIHVMTSAHCIKDMLKRGLEFKVVLGLHELKDFDSFPSLEVIDYVWPDEYDDDNIYYDIGILTLKEPVLFIDGFNPVCLPNFDETDNMFVYGFGKQYRYGHLRDAEVMHEVELDRIPAEVCENHLRGKKWFQDLFTQPQTFDDKLTMCSMNHMRNTNICKGDSGSPVSTRKDGQIYAVGIPSIVHKTCNTDQVMRPTLYEKVFAHQDWIREKTKDGQFCYGKHHPFNKPIVTSIGHNWSNKLVMVN